MHTMVGSDDDHAVAELDGVVAGRDAALAAADDRGDEHGVLELERLERTSRNWLSARTMNSSASACPSATMRSVSTPLLCAEFCIQRTYSTMRPAVTSAG